MSPAYAAAPIASNVTVIGTPEVGQVLTGSYTYFDADGDLEGGSFYQWLRNGAPILGANGLQYTLQSADLNAMIVFRVTPIAATALDGLFIGATVFSPPVGPVAPANTAPIATSVAIAGATNIGSMLSGSYAYSDADMDAEDIAATALRWLRDGLPIAGENTANYIVANEDVGATLMFEVTPAALTGVSPGVAVTSPGLPITNAAPTASNVIISGAAAIGETLTGSYDYIDADNDLEDITATALRWLRDGVAIAGATTETYDVVAADLDATLRFEVTPAALTGTSPGAPVVSAGVLISNTAPTITGQVPLTTAEEVALEITLDDLTVDDPDNDYPDDFTLNVGSGANYSSNVNVITPDVDFNGDLSVPVTVNDGASNSPVFNLTVSVTAVNDRPTIISQDNLSTQEDASLTIVIGDVTVDDPDNVNFTLALQDGDDYSLAGNVITPDENFSGSLQVPATVTDDSGEPNATSAARNLTVTVVGVNDDPTVATPIVDQNGIEGTPFALDISANFDDPDGDDLAFAVDLLALPVNIGFDPATGVFSGTPTIDDARDNDPYIIVVTASDGQPGSIAAADEFNLNISALDRADVSLGIGVTPDPAMMSDPLQWTFTVANAPGLQPAASIELNGSFVGAGLAVTPPAGCTLQPPAGQVTNFVCVVGDLPPGGTSSVILTTQSNEIGDVTAFAIAEGTLPVPIDPNVEDNSAQSAVGVAESFSKGAVQVLGATNVLSVAAGDVNGDGAADLIVGTAAGQPVQIFLSDGFRDFASTPISISDTGANEGIALADFDGNGTLDLVVVNGGGQADTVYGNDGAGNFTVMATLAIASFSQGVALADFDSNGTMDVAIAAVGANPVYSGSGGGAFTLQASLGNANSHDVAVAALDTDLIDDLVFANVGSDSQVWVYDAVSSSFTSRDSLAIGDAVAVAAGNFGGGPRQDLAFARVPAAIGDVSANPVLINTGNGTFGSPLSLLGAAPTFDILAGNVNDTDGAGADDLVFVNSSGVHQIWVANGTGFDLHSEQIADRDSLAAVLTDLGFADVGDSGGIDLAMGGAIQSGVGVFLNDGFGNLGRGDAVAPVLTLVGDAQTSTPAGTVYSDAGAAAEDNIDGDISTSVVVTGTVNTSVVGDYVLTYNVADFAGNAAAPISRTVTVSPATGTGGGGGGGSLSILYTLFLLTIVLTATLIRAEQRTRQIRKARVPAQGI